VPVQGCTLPLLNFFPSVRVLGLCLLGVSHSMKPATIYRYSVDVSYDFGFLMGNYFEV